MDSPGLTLPFQNFLARLSEKTQLSEADKFWLFHFELTTPNKIEFKAGQYVQFTVPNTPQKKSYSIASAPQVDHAIEIMVDVSPHGAGTTFLLESEPGTEVSFMGPLGQFVVEPKDTPVGAAEKSLVFVATGSGVAPIRSMLEDLLIYQGDDRPMVLHWGLRNPEDQCWFEDFELLSEQHNNFQFHPVFSQAPDQWPLCRGRVTDCLTVHDLLPDAGYYLCGNNAMIQDAIEVLLNKGVEKQHIHHEKFY